MITPPLTLTRPSAAQCALSRIDSLSALGRGLGELLPAFVPFVAFCKIFCFFRVLLEIPFRHPDTLRHGSAITPPIPRPRLALLSTLNRHANAPEIRPHPTPKFSLRAQRGLPLPKGEGRGEGERSLLTQTACSSANSAAASPPSRSAYMACSAVRLFVCFVAFVAFCKALWLRLRRPVPRRFSLRGQRGLPLPKGEGR